MNFSPRRKLGRTGFVATALGVGDLADRSLGLDACVATLRRALDAGLNVVDTAPAYEAGFSEEIVGRALEGRREGIFVIDKVDELDEAVGPQIDASLARLAFEPDAFVFHGVSKIEDWNALVAPGGGMDDLAEAIRRGDCRYRGISSHDPSVVRAAITSGACDLVMFAVGPHVDRRYVYDLLPLARTRDVGTVCFKTFGAGKLVAKTEGYGRPLSDPAAATAPLLTASDCVRATLTFDPDVALLGLSNAAEQDAAFAAAEKGPLSRAELLDVCARAADAMRGKGEIWWNPPA
jgi:1-deoxyxylulose-5-phosphate synthase